MSDNQNPSYPECDKLSEVEDESHAIGNFLEFLSNKGIHLGEFTQREGYSQKHFEPISTSGENLLMEYFEIDTKKLEAERRAMIKALGI